MDINDLVHEALRPVPSTSAIIIQLFVMEESPVMK